MSDMDGKEAFNYLQKELTKKFDRRQAAQMSKIYFEDIFNVRFPSQKKQISESEWHVMKEDIRRLFNGYPLVYITGKTNFYGLDLMINDRVLIPRPETEQLVDWLVEDCKGHGGLSLLDIGTGSGCIAVALAKHLTNCEVSAIDVSAEALDLASMNADYYTVDVRFIHGSALDPDFKNRTANFDILVSNPPYIDKGDPMVSNSTRLYEPDLALFAGEKGLLFYKRFAEVLREGQILYLEINEFLSQEIRHLFLDKGWSCDMRKDLQGKDRMLKVYR